MLVTFSICFKQHFDTRYLVCYNASPPRMFLSLDIWEYRIRHGANGPLFVTSSYSTWIFCRGVSGFATDCPFGVWCRGLTTCLLHVGPPFGNRILNKSRAVGLTQWIMNLIFLCFDICNYMSWYIRSFFGFTFLNILYFLKYPCTNIFNRRSLYTLYIYAYICIYIYIYIYTCTLCPLRLTRNPLTWRLYDFMSWISNYIPSFLWHIIGRPYPT